MKLKIYRDPEYTIIWAPYENSATKIISIVISVLMTAVGTPILFLLIRFERDNPYRILVNQLITGMMYIGILYTCTVHSIYLMIYVIGPLHPILCLISFTLHGAYVNGVLLLSSAVITTRFIFTFHLKNPTAFQHDFWCLYITLSIGVVSLIYQLVYVFFSPGRLPASFFVCLGKFNQALAETMPRKSTPFYIFFVIAGLIHCYCGFRLKVYELKSSTIQILVLKTKRDFTFDKNQIVTASFHILLVIIFYIICLPVIKFQAMTLPNLNSYPDYLWMYYLHLYCTPAFITLTVTVILVRNRQFRAFCVREVAELIKR